MSLQQFSHQNFAISLELMDANCSELALKKQKIAEFERDLVNRMLCLLQLSDSACTAELAQKSYASLGYPLLASAANSHTVSSS